MEAIGFKFRRFETSVEDPCLPIDVEWNYKDLVHVSHVHSHMSREFLFIGKNIYTTFDLHRVLGITIPQSASFYVTESNRIFVQTTLFLFLILVEIQYEKAGDMRTITRTRYAIGARSGILRLLTPFIQFMIKNNAAKFTADDRALRRRRGELRLKGYDFGDQSPIDHRDTLRIMDTCVVLPRAEKNTQSVEIPLAAERGVVKLVGESDHLGLQVHLDHDMLRIYPRLCPHKGCSLDGVQVASKTIDCPWHGRRFQPLARIEYNDKGRRLEGPFHRCSYNGEKLTIEIGTFTKHDAPDWTESWRRIDA